MDTTIATRGKARALLVHEDEQGAMRLRAEVAQLDAPEVEFVVEVSPDDSALLGHDEIDAVVLVASQDGRRTHRRMSLLCAERPDLPMIVVRESRSAGLPHDFMVEGAQDVLEGPAELGFLPHCVRFAIERMALRVELRRRSEELASRERLFRDVVENNADAIVVLDRCGDIRFANRSAEALFRRPRESLCGTPFGYPVLIGETTELHVLTERVAEMRVTELEWEGQPSFVATLRDCTDRKRVARELHAKARELERSNEELERFAYVAAHDLQEPLRVITGFARLLDKKHSGRMDDEGREYLDFIRGGVARMANLIHDLLEYSRYSTRAVKIETVSLDDCVDRALRDLAESVRECDATIEREPLPSVEADASQMTRLFQNLISNALKYRSPDRAPRVRISAIATEIDCRVRIADNGIGISEADSERIFGIFKRLHSNEDIPGTGIGLAICQRIVERHGGAIRVLSETGDGTTFQVTLPRIQEDG